MFVLQVIPNPVLWVHPDPWLQVLHSSRAGLVCIIISWVLVLKMKGSGLLATEEWIPFSWSCLIYQGTDNNEEAATADFHLPFLNGLFACFHKFAFVGNFALFPMTPKSSYYEFIHIWKWRNRSKNVDKFFSLLLDGL